MDWRHGDSKRIFSVLLIFSLLVMLLVGNSGMCGVISITDIRTPLTGLMHTDGSGVDADIRQQRLADFHENWRQGYYTYSTGEYSNTKGKLCHVDYDLVKPGREYRVTVSDPNYRLLVRELDCYGNRVNSTDCTDGKVIRLLPVTEIVGISVYAPKNNAVTYEAYEQLFAGGFQAGISLVPNGIDDDPEPVPNWKWSPEEESLRQERIDSFHQEWRVGQYAYSTGIYSNSTTNRICHTDYEPVFGGERYRISISDPNFRMVIRELDKDYTLIKSSDGKDGSVFILQPKTAYAGVVLYTNTWSEITYVSYESLFAEGLQASFDLAEDLTQRTQAFRLQLVDQIDRGDSQTMDVSRYHLSDQVIYEVFDQVLQQECNLAYQCMPQVALSVTCDQQYFAKTVVFSHMPADLPQRVADLKAEIKAALGQLKPQMGDLEKALILHDHLLERTIYEYQPKDPGIGAYHALVEKKALCSGYTQALALLYRQAGLETICVSGNDENHAWLLVRIDGQYYHVDPTWNDLQSYYRHYYFIRSDAQFEQPDKGDSHFHWQVDGDIQAASTAYDDWFGHDVVGKLVYWKGFWYYASGKELIRTGIQGENRETVMSELEFITIQSVDEDGIIYTVGDNTKRYQGTEK